MRLCLCALSFSCAGPVREAPREHVYLPRGASLRAVSDSLAAHGMIGSGWGFRVYARLRGLERRIRPGRYAFPRGERWATIVGALKSGRTDDFLFTVPEGLTLEEIADLASRKLRLARDSVREAIRDSLLAAGRDPRLIARLGFSTDTVASLEGYVFPETYRVAFDETPRQLVSQMARQFLAVWDTGFDRRAAALGLTRHQVVTLASIVEEEARVNAERPIIAGVYLNRLRRGMLLQADPTIIYALGKRVQRVLYKDLRVKSPYNTYRYRGLPPGPIASPGRASLLATVEPGRHAYLFFVARPDGSHIFTRTPREHAAAVAEVRRVRAAVAADSAAAPPR